MSTNRCPHVEWITQPSQNRYLYHCRSCSVIISYDLDVDTWRISHDPAECEPFDEMERQNAFNSLDYWMTQRESVFGHEIFIHPHI